ncbi:MAG: bifunctional adenosylcobinamide kinase/adenosylcobinamide-phosphate guanylyltransferase [Lachnotalea sp.]
MIILITGGSGSGKSEYAENLAMKLNQKDEMTYIATMHPYGKETLLKIERHKEMRKGKGFETIECSYALKDITKPIHSTVLLECMSNLAANELYMDQGAKENALKEMMDGIQVLSTKSDNLIIISNEIFNEDMEQDIEMTTYIQLLASVNKEIGRLANVVCEVVYSIPVFYKGKL